MNYYQLSVSELPGPTALYSGLSNDNVASLKNREAASNPYQLAIQSLQRMRILLEAGVPQVLLPPQCRPDWQALEVAGFDGELSDKVKLADAFSPSFLASTLSISSIWTANAATVTPSEDSVDDKIHITIANLSTHYHRYIEAPATFERFAKVFSSPEHFKVHQALDTHHKFADEGAANHMHFGIPGQQPGLNVFVFGNDPSTDDSHFSRQTLWASKTLSRLHRLPEENVLYVRQSKEVINAGIFHNDIIAANHHDLLVFHESAYENSDEFIEKLQAKGICCVPILANELSINEALDTYFFNSEFITSDNGELILILSEACRNHSAVQRQLEKIQASYGKPMRTEYVDLSDSIRNGGGPACLRLRMLLNQQQLDAIDSRYLLTREKLDELSELVGRHYRQSLRYTDILQPDYLTGLSPTYAAIEEALEW